MIPELSVSIMSDFHHLFNDNFLNLKLHVNIFMYHYQILFYANLFVAGNVELDQVLFVLLSTAMFVGGVIGFLLDNTVPGKYISRVTSGL